MGIVLFASVLTFGCSDVLLRNPGRASVQKKKVDLILSSTCVADRWISFRHVLRDHSESSSAGPASVALYPLPPPRWQLDAGPRRSVASDRPSTSSRQTMAHTAPQPVAGPSNSSWLPAKSWQHFVAGGYASCSDVTTSSYKLTLICQPRLGGMCGAIVTSPFDVVKTRLQSSLFREKHTTLSLAGNGVVTVPHRTGLLYNFVETGHILRYADVTRVHLCNVVLNDDRVQGYLP